MQKYEFKVVPAPRRGDKVRGLKTTEERFAHALMGVMNDLGREGWDYVRADTLPCDERVGLTGSKTGFQNMLVFRRALAEPLSVAAPASVPASVPAPAAASVPASVPTRLMAIEPIPDTGPRLGAAEAPTGPAPALGSAKAGLAAAE